MSNQPSPHTIPRRLRLTWTGSCHAHAPPAAQRAHKSHAARNSTPGSAGPGTIGYDPDFCAGEYAHGPHASQTLCRAAPRPSVCTIALLPLQTRSKECRANVTQLLRPPGVGSAPQPGSQRPSASTPASEYLGSCAAAASSICLMPPRVSRRPGCARTHSVKPRRSEHGAPCKTALGSVPLQCSWTPTRVKSKRTNM